MEGDILVGTGPLVRKRARARTKNGRWRKKRSDAGKKRGKRMSRDTQFMNYAMLVHNEILAIENEGLKNNWNNIDIYRRQQEIMARRAYDLVLHAVENVDMVDLARLFRQEIAERIPDMIEPPKEQGP